METTRPTENVATETASPATERKKFAGLKTSNSVRAKAPNRIDIAQLGLAVDTKLSDLPKMVSKFQADIDAGIKAGGTVEGIDLSKVKASSLVVRGTIYAQVVEASE